MPRITLKPSNTSFDTPHGTILADALHTARLHLPTPCGGKGLCGKCRVQFVENPPPIDEKQQRCLPPHLLADNWRAACVLPVTRDLVIADPEPEQKHAILTDFATRSPTPDHNLWRRPLTLPKPNAADQQNDHHRLLAALADADLANVEIPLPLLQRLPRLLRHYDFAVEAVGLDNLLLAVRPQNAATPLLGLAVDLGTTTLAAALCDLETAAVLAVASRANPQSLRGDDVISRIDHAAQGEKQLDELRRLAVDAIHALADETLSEAGLDAEPVLLLAVGGNTVMNHLIAGVDPSPLALSPFIPCFRTLPPLPAAAIGWPETPGPVLLVVPNIAAYVGGDITAGILAHNVAENDKNTLFLDIGTNGEIALRANGKTYACAAAAGPAFEGARIGQGMRAVPGAICRVDATPDGDLDVGTVEGETPAKGICGTGLLDAVAALRVLGAVDEGGRLLDADEAEEENLPAPLRARLFEDDAGAAVWIEPPSAGNAGVRLTQRDVRELQLAKGAIAAGVRVLLGVAGIAAEDVDSVLLAGGFGNYLRPASAVGVGIVPGGIAPDKIASVGNASLAGTRHYLVSQKERRRAESLSAAIEYVELSGRDDFQTAFAEEMLFPEQ